MFLHLHLTYLLDEQRFYLNTKHLSKRILYHSRDKSTHLSPIQTKIQWVGKRLTSAKKLLQLLQKRICIANLMNL